MFRQILPAVAVLLLPTFVLAQVPPEKCESTFTVADGLEFKLWASEPLFVNPTCMDIDHLGRVWVCESVNYRNKLHNKPKLNRAKGDRIVILEDSKGTGKADKAIIFYQSPELLAPLGIAVAKDPEGPGCKVFVCQSPDILVFEDKDGDGKADGPPKKLLTGFGGYDHDHGVHGILIGPDMKLYFSVGDRGVQGLQSSDGKGRKWTSNDTDCQAGTIWRCDMDGRNLELIAHNFRNEYEPCVDSFGTVFVSDNDDDGNEQTRICYVMPGGNYGYHPRGPGETHWHEEQPGVVPKILRTYFGSPTGMCVYEGTLLPKKYWGQLLHTDAGPRQVRCYHLKPQGAGDEVAREDMVTSTDKWFRPSDICVAPDGSAFVADWYDPGVGGHGMGDIRRGRIFRLAPKGSKPSVPKVDLETKEGIIAALGAPALSVRYMAMAKLQKMQVDQAWQTIESSVFMTDNAVLFARATWQLFALTPKFGDRHLSFSNAPPDLRNADERLKILYLRAWRQVLGKSVGDVPELLDSSPAVRREYLLLSRDADPATAKPLIYQLAKRYDGHDRFYLEAIGIAVGHHDQARRAIILADFEKEFPEWNDKVADLVWELQPPAVMAKLGERLADKKLTGKQRARIVDILAVAPDAASGKTLLKAFRSELPADVRDKILATLERFLPGKWSALRKSPELTELIAHLMEMSETLVTGLSLIGAAAKTESVEAVAKVVLDTQASEPSRKEAVHVLGVLPCPEAIKALQSILADKNLAADAAASLGKIAKDAKVPSASTASSILEKTLLDKQVNVETRQAVLASLATTRRGTTWLLSLQEKGELEPSIKADAARLLRNSSFQDIRNKARIAFPPPGKLNLKNLPSPSALAARRGNVTKGKKLLADSLKNDMQCLKCHTALGTGGKVGPDLSTIGKKASRENLFESILYPSKAIADQYLTWVIETKKGLQIIGLLVEENATSVTLRDGNGKDTRIDKSDIDSRQKSPKSLMPEDLLAYITEDDLVDMVEYLLTLKDQH
jgi:putative membrane-bound dehydrogenase-like protein